MTIQQANTAHSLYALYDTRVYAQLAAVSRLLSSGLYID